MSLKHIVLHGPAIDNAGNFKDAGSELTVGEDAKEDFITSEQAHALVNRNAAVSRTAAEQMEQNPAPVAKAALKKRRTAKAKPAAKPAPTPAPPPPPVDEEEPEPEEPAPAGNGEDSTATP